MIARIKKNGNRDDVSFGAKYDPCVSLFQKLQSVFKQAPKESPDDLPSAVTLSANFPGLSSIGKKASGHSGPMTLCSKTDNSTFQMLNPETLEPIGVAQQSVLHPDLRGPLSAAHACHDPVTGDVFNYNLEFGRSGAYRVFHVSAITGKTSVLATIQHAPAYLHSLFITEHYVILCVWNSLFRAGGAALMWKKNFVDAMKYDASKPATWFVIDRTPVENGGHGVVATYESDPFFCFHSINAYEEPSATDDSKTDIVADLSAFENLDVIQRFYIENMLSDSPQALAYSDPEAKSYRPVLRRFRLPHLPTKPNAKPTKAVSEFKGHHGESPELPTINNAFGTSKHRYIYGVTDTGRSTFLDGLVKHDSQTRTSIFWNAPGQTPGEPIFVADPESEEEDGGVVLSVVLDGVAGKSYLLALNAKDFKEVGRANVDGVVGFGFHGTHVPHRIVNEGQSVSSKL
jgi:torulene dioxygenase